MPTLENNTPFSAEVFGLLDPHAREYVVLVVSATFVAMPGLQPTIAGEQAPVRATDEFHGDPASTSIRYPADIALEKPVVDVLISGRAYAPRGRPIPAMTVRLRVGDAIGKELFVSGDRFWHRGAAGLVASSPLPFETMPIIYERAFGGNSPYDARNPVGVGVRRTPSVDASVQTEIPNIEYPTSRMDTVLSRPQPAGFGALSPGWEPRIGYAGTYDEAWLREQAPLLPHDFNPRFFQVAPEDQQVQSLRGGELIEVRGMTPEGHWSFQLPTLSVPVHLVYRDRVAEGGLRMDTVLLEPDDYRITLTARLAVPISRNRAPLAQVIIGEIRRAWWRARAARKTYRPAKVPT